jgi:hypothetical protein
MKLLILVIAVGVVLQTAKGLPLDVHCDKKTTVVETIEPTWPSQRTDFNSECV